MIKAVILFIVGLVLLIKGGDWFVDGATGIAERFHVPELIIGATVVSIGTTLPEVMVSANSALSGHGEMAYGNALGSIICNTALIAAITVAVKPGKVDRKTLRVPVAFFFTAMLIYAFGAYIRGSFERPLGLILLCAFAVYMVILVQQALAQMKLAGAEGDSNKLNVGGTDSRDIIIEEKSERDNTGDVEKASENDVKNEKKEKSKKENPLWKDILLLVFGAALIAEGADLLVDNGTIIAQAMGVPESVIALTFIALGTSLPELVTAITSLAKGHGALSLGNVCGANLFNLVLVSGLSISLSPFGLPSGKTVNIGGNIANASLVIDLPLATLVMVILTIPALIKGELKRWQGISLLAMYAGFCAFQFM
ncbi:MAG: calcium/sodium antiporter [Lachnospiraceae bacterium]|nr:calcium/sodium antiporter [Lachnospiraceae bacterium]